MGFRRFMAAAALMVCGTGLMAGCPNVGGLVDSLAEGLNEIDFDELGSDSGTTIPDGSKPNGDVNPGTTNPGTTNPGTTNPGTTKNAIADGMYDGTNYGSTTIWQDGEEYWSGDWNEALAITYADDGVVVPFGGMLAVGDMDDLDFGDLQVSRVVDEIEPWGDGFDVWYELTATWSGIQLTGIERIEHIANADGSVSVYDLMSLKSLDFVDGVQGWEIEIYGEGDLTASGGVVNPGTPTHPSNPLDDDILDKKSGKIRR